VIKLKQESDRLIKWNYNSFLDRSNGYENVMDDLKSYTKNGFIAAGEDSQKNMVDEVFEIYRSKNIFPITYYNENGIRFEVKKCIDKTVTFDENYLNLKFNQGLSLCRFLFPNLMHVECAKDKRTPYRKFYDDHMLKRAILFCFKHKNVKNPVLPSAIKDGIEMLGGGVATNFKPMNAKALYEKFVPENGIIYDYSCGYGGRMLGALSSKNNYTYIGVEPNTNTYENLIKLGNYIEETTGRRNSFEIHKIGSEDFRIEQNNSIDFAFSSPPYFNLEHYSDEETQSYIKYPSLDLWFEGYVRPTIHNIYHMLKKNCFYAVNIADFNIGKIRVKFVNEWIRISEEEGFTYIKEIPMKLQNRRGIGHGENVRGKKEGIFIFKK
jgi:hypothetical protein